MSFSVDEELPPYPHDEDYDDSHLDEKESYEGETVAESFDETLDNADDVHGWKFMICAKTFDRLTVFTSKSSIQKYLSLKDEPQNSKARDSQFDGIGVPLFWVKNHKFSISNMITIYKYYINHDTFHQKGFNPETDYFQFCHVSQSSHAQYRTYVLKFTPDPKNSNLDFELVLYAHYIVPVIDYEYKGKFYRWIYGYSTKELRYTYSHYLLDDNQHCIARHVDKSINKIDFEKSKDNPLLQGYMKKLFNKRDKYPRDEYYSSVNLGTLEEKRKRIRIGSYKLDTDFELQDTNYNVAKPIDYYSINSVDLQTSTYVCMAILLKRSEDIKKHREEHKRRRKSFEAVNNVLSNSI
ncbi:hypothetical protein DFJ63DRAFT_257955 [Scheffersomyces coipomensis]|uniref:uncharacterized protein n=1 Tax=Scheffersomyces coipomensis TaxID=1788519 RepID=UPI00315D9E54